MKFWILLAAAGLLGCSSTTEDVHAAVASGCRSAAECAQLQTDALLAYARCQRRDPYGCAAERRDSELADRLTERSTAPAPSPAPVRGVDRRLAFELEAEAHRAPEPPPPPPCDRACQVARTAEDLCTELADQPVADQDRMRDTDAFTSLREQAEDDADRTGYVAARIAELRARYQRLAGVPMDERQCKMR